VPVSWRAPTSFSWGFPVETRGSPANLREKKKNLKRETKPRMAFRKKREKKGDCGLSAIEESWDAKSARHIRNEVKNGQQKIEGKRINSVHIDRQKQGGDLQIA